MTASPLNTLEGVRFRPPPPPSFASAVSFYFSSCELMGNTPFPVRGRVVVEWISLFNPGGTYRNYINYIWKAFCLIDQPVRWYTNAAVFIAKGLKLAGKAKYSFPNFIEISSVVKIINFESRKSVLAQIFYLAFLFALRVPSGPLIIRRSYKGMSWTSSHLWWGRRLSALGPRPARGILRYASSVGRTFRMGALCRAPDCAL